MAKQDAFCIINTTLMFRGDQSKKLYPQPQSGNKAAWPGDEEGIGQNLAYFFTGNLLKMNRILYRHLSDEQIIRYLCDTDELNVIDMAC